jgi:hypothetical protein
VEKKNIGSSFDSWLREEGIREQVTAAAVKRVRARQSTATAAKNGITSKSKAKKRYVGS